MTQSVALDLHAVGRLFEDAQKIVIASHLRPDGDAIGSLVALGETLLQCGKEVTLLNEDPVPSSCRFLKSLDRIRRPATLQGPLEADLFAVLDTSAGDRVGDQIRSLVAPSVPMLVIDHHITNTHFGNLHYVDANSPATGQIVYQLIRLMNWPVTPLVREHLWVAINTDTGSFQYPSTTAETLRIAAELVEGGVDVGSMSAALYQEYPARRLKLLGRLLPTLDLRADGRLASWRMRHSDLRELAIGPGDTEGLIEHLRAIEGVVMAVSFEESPDGQTVRVSARSKDSTVADVASICCKFGGGGHQLAAGATLSGSLDTAAELFLKTATQTIENGSN